jgi:5'-deoxynucleotidase YfbR-like HD superfamily hydrolase
MSKFFNTFSGGRFYFEDGNNTYKIEDIAHALSLECRWMNQTKWHYSVAQHSIYVSYLVPTLKALLHDAEEAFWRDMSTQVKRADFMAAYKMCTEATRRDILRVFCGDSELSPEIKIADKRVYIAEAQVLMPANWFHEQNVDPNAYEPFGYPIERWTPEQAEEKFLKRYAELING